MPPTRPLSTPCRYGYTCTRPDCFYTHPKGVNKDKDRPKDERPLCAFGRGCYRKICYNDHPNGRIMDQLRADVDYCATWILVRPHELGRVSAAFQEVFPAPNDGKDGCDFVAAVPVSVVYYDWKRYRGVSATGTPDGVPSTPQKIELYPRTRKGERLLQDAENRAGMRWSPTPYHPWKMLERMATHDQHWENNLENYVLCAGYEVSPPGNGVCIELAVTGMVKPEDGGDGQKAGARVAREVTGFPGTNMQRWFVFHVSLPEESGEVAQVVTVRTIVDTSKMPAEPRRFYSRAIHPAEPPVPPLASAVSATTAAAAPPAAFGVHQQRPRQQQGRGDFLQVPAISTGSSFPPPPPSSPSSSYAFSNSTSSASNSPEEVLVQGFTSFGTIETTPAAVTATTAPSPPPQASSSPRVGDTVLLQQQQQQQFQQPEGSVDELSELLASLNMTKFRPRFDSSNVDFKALKRMTWESELLPLDIPLGPRIKLMKELGIARS